MRRSSPNNNKSGMALIELMMVAAILSLILTSLCGTFFMVQREWQRQRGREDALMAASRASSRLASYISQCIDVTVLNRFGTGDAIAVNLPMDTANGAYAPVWSGGRFSYRGGSWIVFYLSDLTGGYQKSGNVLWAASFPSWGGFPGNLVPDASWSLYYGGRGRIEPVSSLRFTLDTTGVRPKVVLTVTSSYRVGGISRQLSQSRTVCVRNTKS